MQTKQRYRIKENIAIVSKLTKEIVRGNLVNEKNIDGKDFWVLSTQSRPNTQLNFSKDAWVLQKGKIHE